MQKSLDANGDGRVDLKEGAQAAAARLRVGALGSLGLRSLGWGTRSEQPRSEQPRSGSEQRV